MDLMVEDLNFEASPRAERSPILDFSERGGVVLDQPQAL